MSSRLYFWLPMALATGLASPLRSTAAVRDAVDINRASAAELMQIPGLPASWAARIFEYRPYRSKADLVQLGILTAPVYERIKQQIVAHRIEMSTKREQGMRWEISHDDCSEPWEASTH